MSKEVYIIGGGNSLKGFDFNKLKDKETIVVNKAIFHVPNPTYFLTMDYSFLMKMVRHLVKMGSMPATKVFIANLTKDYMKQQNGQIIDTRFPLVYDLWRFDMIIKSYSTGGFGFTFNDFRNGECSGYCALQFAILLGYETIYLLGFDLKADNKTHYHDGYGESIEKFREKLEIYHGYFKWGLEKLADKPNIQVISLSKGSRLNEIISYKDIAEVL